MIVDCSAFNLTLWECIQTGNRQRGPRPRERPAAAWPRPPLALIRVLAGGRVLDGDAADRRAMSCCFAPCTCRTTALRGSRVGGTIPCVSLPRSCSRSGERFFKRDVASIPQSSPFGQRGGVASRAVSFCLSFCARCHASVDALSLAHPSRKAMLGGHAAAPLADLASALRGD
eukprot:448886-Prymnesium_polylepis.2